MSVAKISRSVFFGMSAFTLRNESPQVQMYAIDSTSVEIREGDPVKEVSGGRIVRAAPTDTALLGLAAEGQNTNLPTSIAALASPTDSSGNPIINVYVFDVDSVFMGEILGTPSDALKTQVHDLAYAAAPPTPTITPEGTTGATTIAYKITCVTTVGESIMGSAGTTTSANATLSATNFNQISIPYVNSRVVQFGVYLSATGLLIGYVSANQTVGGATIFNDTGLTGGAAAVTTDYSGWAINDGADSTGVVKIDAIDSRPALPGRTNQLVRWRVPAAKSQWLAVAGS